MKQMFLVLAVLTAACAPRRLPTPLPPLPQEEPGVAPAGPLRPVLHAPGTPEPHSAPAAPAVLASVTGEATYYADRFDGRRTASGIVFRNRELYAAHRSWPFGTVVLVTRVSTGRSVVVTVVDRGPHGTSERARRTIIDLSRRAAEELDFIYAGRTPVLVEVLSWGGAPLPESRERSSIPSNADHPEPDGATRPGSRAAFLPGAGAGAPGLRLRYRRDRRSGSRPRAGAQRG